MDESELAHKLAEFHGKGYVIAPAGFGKTHLIALAVDASEKKQLILTHTYAGVNALRSKMHSLGVSSSKYQIDTIASWTLRLCLSYPKVSGWDIKMPEGNQWTDLYEKCATILELSFVKRIIRASYSGLFVDEYQDCTITQHNIVCALGNILPCRILGDPLQAIFDFADPTVDWDDHVSPDFTNLGELSTPWRWKKAGAEDLGKWLSSVRKCIENESDIDLTAGLPPQVKINKVDIEDYRDRDRLSVFYKLLHNKDTVIAIHGGAPKLKVKTHNLAKILNGRFSSIEEIEGTTLFLFIKNISNAATGDEKLKLVIDFAIDCMTGVNTVLSTGTKKGQKVPIIKNTKSPEITILANKYLDDTSSLNLMKLLIKIRDASGTSLYRRDLFYRLIQVLRMHSSTPNETLKTVAENYQTEFRQNGRPIRYNKLIGTTLLVKGLEYDHAIILAPHTLSKKELYVAMTRGSKGLTIFNIGGKIKINKESIIMDQSIEGKFKPSIASHLHPSRKNEVV